ncbi:MAG: NUDIX domain-containing protein [Mycobacteriales bacterium]|nr:NUDIX domain-containing protein [Mycobacteriales bacterium]
MGDRVIEREAARVLLVDAADRVLLFLGCDPAEPDAGQWWFTPGGGLEQGESARAGAVREVFEETGLRLSEDDLTGPVHSETAEFSLGGDRYRQTGEFYLARVDAHEVDTAGFSALEQSFVLDHRWWTREDLRATTETVFPASLVDLLDRHG